MHVEFIWCLQSTVVLKPCCCINVHCHTEDLFVQCSSVFTLGLMVPCPAGVSVLKIALAPKLTDF